MTTQQTDYADSITTWTQRIHDNGGIAAAMDVSILEASDDHVRLQWVKNDFTRRPADGGWTGVALSAMAMGTAEIMPYANGRLAAGLVVQLDINLVANSKDERILGEGRWMHRGGNLLTSEIRLTDGAGQLVVLATATHVPLTRPLRPDGWDHTAKAQ